MAAQSEGAAAAGDLVNRPAKGGWIETSRHTHQTTATQQKISNFLCPEDSSSVIPKHFLDFCRDSIEAIRGNRLYTIPAVAPDFGSTQYDGADGFTLDLATANDDHIVKLNPIVTGRPVIAVDTSSIKLGELADGVLCALRGAVVVLEAKRYRYVRYGPFVFSLGYNSPLVSRSFTSLGLPPFSGEPNFDSLLKRVRNMLERWIQYNVGSSVGNAFLLIDGSLTAGTPDNPSRELERILEVARSSGSALIAISKKTKLRIRNEGLTELLEHESDPCLLDVDTEITEQFPPYPVQFLGRVFVAKLARFGFPFRIDIDRHIPTVAAMKEFAQLAGTDIVDQGYPETLRMAHVLSTFTAMDVLAMQAFAQAEFGVQMMPKLALRHSLFGPFGTAWEALH